MDLQSSLFSGARASGEPPRIALLVPCHNEARTIAAVIDGFKVSLPQAEYFVFDNNSTDGTAAVARGCGKWACRGRAMWSGACSPTWKRTFT